MRRRKIFRRAFICYTVILLLSIFFIELYITRIVRDNYVNNLKDSLSIQAVFIAKGIPFESPADIDGLCKQLKEESGARVTVISADGTVLGDSDKHAALMDNHKNRPEIQQAILKDSGWAIRYSDTLNYELLYTARKIIQKGEIAGFVRLSIPLVEVNTAVNSLRFKILMAVILVLVASGLLMVWLTERIRRLVRQTIDFSSALAQGSLDRRLYLQGAGEFDELAQNLNTMSEALKITIDRCTEETNCLNVILKSIPDALLIINPNDTIEQSNSAFGKLFGSTAITGKQFAEVIRNPEFFFLVEDVKKRLTPGIREMKIDYPEEKYLEVLVSPLFYKEGVLSGYVAIFHDTTHLKRLEEMRKDFVANVSHEIKTPVTAIKGFAETLLDGALDDRTHADKFLNTIRSQSERLNRLVEDLLTISRIELGVIKIEKKEVDVSLLMDSVIETLKRNADAKGLSLKKSLLNGETKIHADRDRVLQILINLVDNAIKFTERGGVEIGYTQNGSRKYLFVRDTGIGVPGRYLSRLGERFFRVDPSRSRELGGTGLGLAIVKHLVKAHGWTMEIQSEKDEGTQVKIIVDQKE